MPRKNQSGHIEIKNFPNWKFSAIFLHVGRNFRPCEECERTDTCFCMFRVVLNDVHFLLRLSNWRANDTVKSTTKTGSEKTALLSFRLDLIKVRVMR